MNIEDEQWTGEFEVDATDGSLRPHEPTDEIEKLNPHSDFVQNPTEAPSVRRLNKQFLAATAVAVVSLFALIVAMSTGEEGENVERNEAEQTASPADISDQTVDSMMEDQEKGAGDFKQALTTQERKEMREAEVLQRQLEEQHGLVVSEDGEVVTKDQEAKKIWKEARRQAQQQYAQGYFADGHAARKSNVFVASNRAERATQSDREDPPAYVGQGSDVDRFIALQKGLRGGASLADGPGGQVSKKEAFFEDRGAEPTRSFAVLEEPMSAYELQAGTILPLVLETEINSDLPGMVKARFSSPVYDTVSGEHLLIPTGTVVVGTYNSSQIYGDSRLQVAWNRLLLPNGKSMQLGNLPGVGLSGASGLSDQLDEHWDRIIAGALLSSALAGSMAAAGGDQNALNRQPGQAALGGVAESINETGQAITKKNLEIQPTIVIRPGMKVAAFVREDLVLEPYFGP